MRRHDAPAAVQRSWAAPSMTGDVEVRLLSAKEAAVLSHVAPGVFDGRVVARLAEEFLTDPRHHLAVAIDGGEVVGMASAVHYVHPDKPAELWINELGVAPTHRRRGLARKLMARLFAAGRAAGASAAWVLTERTNEAAIRLYRELGGVEPDHETVMLAFDLAGGEGVSEPPPRNPTGGAR